MSLKYLNEYKQIRTVSHLSRLLAAWAEPRSFII